MSKLHRLDDEYVAFWNTYGLTVAPYFMEGDEIKTSGFGGRVTLSEEALTNLAAIVLEHYPEEGAPE
jgi:hypothetical protein